MTKETRVIVEKGGVPVTAIIAAEDLERWTRVEAERSERLGAARERMGAAFGDLPDEQLEHDVAEVIEHVRVKERMKTTAPKTA
jgi:hypothetical protein